MIITIFSVLMGIGFYLFSDAAPPQQNSTQLFALFASVGALFIFLFGIICAVSSTALQKAESKIASRLIDLYRDDFLLKVSGGWLLLFGLINYTLILDLIFFNLFPYKLILSLWISLLGLSLDALVYYVSRIMMFLSPYRVAEKITQAANQSIRSDNEGELCEWIDSLTELLLRSLNHSNLSLCIQVDNEIAKIANTFFVSSKSISHVTDPKEVGIGKADRVSYTLLYLLQRLEMVYEKAVEKRLEPLCSNLITVTGRIAISAVQCDWSLITYPIHFIGRWTQMALEHQLIEVAPKATYVLLEVGKSVIEENIKGYAALKEPFQGIIQHMENIAKELFKLDKKGNIAVLSQPFRDLRDLLRQDTISKHPDASIVIGMLDRVIGEFDALEVVLRTMPPLPKIISE